MKSLSSKTHSGFISLKTKITLLTVLLSVTTTAILGGYLVFESYRALRVQAEQSQLTLAKTLAWQIDESLSRAFQSVEALSKRQQIVKMEPQQAAGEMNLVVYATELIDGFFLFTPDGQLITQSKPSISLKDLPPRSFFIQNVKKSRELHRGVLVDVYKTAASQVGILVGAPIFRSGQLAGVLVGIAYLPNHNIENLENARFGKTGYAFLVNQQGLAVVHPDKSRILDSMLDNPAVQLLQNQKEGVIQFESGEEEVLSAFARVNSASWGVVVRQAAKECYEPATNMLQLMVVFLLIVLGASILAALALAQNVVQPILDLVGQVRQYETSRVDFEYPLSATPKDEVEVLTQSLSRMAKKITRQTQLREKVHQENLSTERKLSESERLATIGQFSAGLAHEMNNPLMVILGSARMARTAKSGKRQNWLNAIEKEGKRCQRLVNDLLTFARPIELRVKKFDLALLIRACWIQIPNDAGQFQIDCPAKSFPVTADPDRIKQVLINILGNAMEAMPGGGVVSVRLIRYKKGIQLSVGDTGTGIPPKKLVQLFRPFFTTKSAGTGLGLVIARSILQAHGGRIRLESRKPRGVWVRMDWPQSQKSGAVH